VHFATPEPLASKPPACTTPPFDALATWDSQWPYQRKVEWMRSLGVSSVLLQPDQRPPAEPIESNALSGAELEAVEDMAFFFHIPNREANLLFQLGRALSKPTPDQQAQVGGPSI
jgi:hypothetical protein